MCPSPVSRHRWQYACGRILHARRSFRSNVTWADHIINSVTTPCTQQWSEERVTRVNCSAGRKNCRQSEMTLCSSIVWCGESGVDLRGSSCHPVEADAMIRVTAPDSTWPGTQVTSNYSSHFAVDSWDDESRVSKCESECHRIAARRQHLFYIRRYHTVSPRLHTEMTAFSTFHCVVPICTLLYSDGSWLFCCIQWYE